MRSSQAREFQKAPRHPKWREANLAAVLPGWKRFEGAEEWLRNRDKTAGQEREKFGAFLAQRVSKPVAPDVRRARPAIPGIPELDQDAPLIRVCRSHAAKILQGAKLTA